MISIAKRKPVSTEGTKSTLPPTYSDEARLNQLRALAYDLVEQRLLDGTATSQETTYFLKLDPEHEKLKRKVLKGQAELLETKARTLESQQKSEELYQEALKAFAAYRSTDD